MIVIFCLLAVLGLGHGKDVALPSRQEIENSINRTIDEVERMVREDPSLPRLTREEIVNILYNITSKDLDLHTDKEAIERTREMYHRALMVVLPYKPSNTSENLKDLYTMPPMTQFISDTNTDKIETILEGRRKSQGVYTKDIKSAQETSEASEKNSVVTQTSVVPEKINFKTNPTTKTRYKNHRETYSDVRTKATFKEGLKLESAPIKFSFNLENLQKGDSSAEKMTTRRPVYEPSTLNREFENSKGQKLEIVYSTSVSTEPTTELSSKEITIDLERPVYKANQNVLSSDQWRYNAPPSTTERSKIKDYIPTTMRISLDDIVTLRAAKKPEHTTRPLSSTIKKSEAIKAERPSPIYVTPMSLTSEKTSKTSTESSDSLDINKSTTTATTMSMRPEVMDLLAAIGLRPDNETNVEDVYNKNKEFVETKYQIPDTNSVIHATTSGLTGVGVDSPSITNQNTFENPESDYRKGVGNLTPDVQLLFQRFGLQTSLKQLSTSTTTKKPTININSYTNFKPLPTSKVKDQEMKNFLARFGLGVNDRRSQKAMKVQTERPSVIEAVPSNMRKVLENIGLISTTQKPNKPTPKTITRSASKNIKTNGKTDKNATSTEPTKFHIFKPHETIVKDEKQKMKINELLDTVRLVQEGKADAQEVQKIANDLLKTTKTLKEGPDPLSLEEILRMYNDDVRNEVKRQQQPEEPRKPASNEQATEMSTNKTTLADSSAKASSSSSSEHHSEAQLSTTTDFPDFLANITFPPDTKTDLSNLAALEQSFGGTTQAPDPVLPTRRKTGLYFLVDWNTFLEVGQEDGEKVNLRFQPKVGDRRNFIRVRIP